MVEGWLPPEAPGGQAPRRWDRPEAARPVPRPDADPARQPAFVRPGTVEQSNGAAVAALVCGICGLVLLLGSAGLMALFSLPLSVCAWVFGIKGRDRADRGEAGQRGLAQAGWIMGVVGTVLGVVAFLGWILVLSLSDGLLDDLREDNEGGL